MTRNSDSPFVGVQIAPQSLMDEGIDYCLDFLQETAGVNALVLYPTLYYGIDGTNVRQPGDPHTSPPRTGREARLPMTWFRVAEKYYADTSLRHAHQTGQEQYTGTDILQDLQEPLQERGMELHLRILDPCWGTTAIENIENWHTILCVDFQGRPTHQPCYANPNYRAWYRANLQNFFGEYPLAGFKFGIERGGPLQATILLGQEPHCFCEHCQATARERGIDVARAREGFTKLYEYVRRCKADPDWCPTDGVFFGFIRLLFEFPELVAWEKMWLDVRDDLMRDLSEQVKACDPDAAYGLHIPQGAFGWSFLERALIDYGKLAEFTDWIKPSLYPQIGGPRARHWISRNFHQGVLREFTEHGITEFLFRAMGLDPAQEPDFDGLAATGFSPESMATETRRVKAACDDKSLVYGGIGFDVPWWDDGPCEITRDPEIIYEATLQILEAGADGLLLSREYDEMLAPNLRAVRRARNFIR